MEAIRVELSTEDVHVMWVCPGYTRSNIRNTALNEKALSQGESPLDEGSLMSAEEVAGHILTAIQRKKRNLVLTFKGKQAVWMNKLLPALTDKLIRNFFFKGGKLVK